MIIIILLLLHIIIYYSDYVLDSPPPKKNVCQWMSLIPTSRRPETRPWLDTKAASLARWGKKHSPAPNNSGAAQPRWGRRILSLDVYIPMKFGY